MKKWIYKIVFSIAFVLLSLVMLPKKEVKALENDFPPILIKATWVSTYFDVENTNTYEWVVTYKIYNAIIENLNRVEYFFTTRRYFSFNHTTFDRTTNSYVIEEIQIEDNSTIFYVRITLSKARFEQYYGILENSDELFSNDSAFYVMYDIYTDAYMEGYDVGYSEGMDRGYGDGYIDGHNDGYNSGYNDGLNDNNGYVLGYNKGKNEGFQNGYDEGHYEGYNSGYNEGYNAGKDEGYNQGYGIGYDTGKYDGFLEGYDEGYTYGYNKGLNDQIADRDFAYLLRSAFIAIGAFLGINLLPGISIGAIIAVPLVFGIIAFILGRKKD